MDPEQSSGDPRLQLLELAGNYLNDRSDSNRFERKDFWFLKDQGKDKDCRQEHDPSVIPIFRVTRRNLRLEGGNDSIVAYDIDDRTSRRWSYRLGDNEQLPRAHPVVTTDGTGRYPVLVAVVTDRTDEPAPGSTLLLIDGETGKELARSNFHGSTHFSMPLVVDEKIVIPMRDSGLAVFSTSPEKNVLYYWQTSLLNRVLRKAGL
jgi:hypothetical protein